MIDGVIAWFAELFGSDEYTFGYDVLRWLGRFNLLLIVIALSPFVFRRVNKHLYKYKNNTIKKILKPLSKRHPHIGIVLLISAFIHGHLALGTLFTVHTGPLTIWILFPMMLLVLFGGKYKIKGWLTVHRTFAIGFIISVLLHLLARNIL